MLGSEVGITNNNVIQYMGAIEQRTTELIKIQQFMQMTVGTVNATLMLVAIFQTDFKKQTFQNINKNAQCKIKNDFVYVIYDYLDMCFVFGVSHI